MPIPGKPPLPPSFAALGFVTPQVARKPVGKNRRLMLATEGGPDTGKTEFLMTCPGPGAVFCLDRGFDAVFDNPRPPESRRADFGFQVVPVPSPGQFADPKQYQPYWLDYLQKYLNALANKDIVTLGIDGDDFSWSMQRLAEHGRLTQIFPQTRYSDVYAARRSFYYKAWDSGKIIVATNSVRDEYRDVIDPTTGLPKPDPDKPGEIKREKTGRLVANGFPDRDYLWQVRIRHLKEPAKYNTVLKRVIPAKWGIRILKAKANENLVGTELWGDECCFEGLVTTVYPHIDPAEWGL